MTPRLSCGTHTRVVGVPLKLSKQTNLGLIIFFIIVNIHNVQVAILTLIKHAIEWLFPQWQAVITAVS